MPKNKLDENSNKLSISEDTKKEEKVYLRFYHVIQFYSFLIFVCFSFNNIFFFSRYLKIKNLKVYLKKLMKYASLNHFMNRVIGVLYLKKIKYKLIIFSQNKQIYLKLNTKLIAIFLFMR